MFSLSVPISLGITQLRSQQNLALGLMVLAFGPDRPDIKEWTFGGFLSNLPRPGQHAQPDSRHSVLATAHSLPPPPPTPSSDVRGDHLYVVLREESEKWRSKSFITRGSYESDDDTGMFLTDDGLAIFVPHQADFEEGESVWMAAAGATPHDDYVTAVAISIRAGEPQSAPDYGDGARLGMIRSRVAARLAELCDWSGNPSIEQAVITAHLTPERLTSADRAIALEFLAPHAAATLDDYLSETSRKFLDGLIRAAKLSPPMAESRLVQLPPARLVKTTRDAEEYAAEFMVALGFTDAAATPVGADGGIDVMASGAVAQVKMEGLPTGRPAVQRIAGAASNKRVDALFFSLAGYTSQAVEWADEANVALFEFAFDGTVEPRSRGAHRLLSQNQTAPRNWYADPLERFEYRWWDGETWTVNVATRGVTQTDPLGIAVE